MIKSIVAIAMFGLFGTIVTEIPAAHANDPGEPVCMAGKSDQASGRRPFTIIATNDKVVVYSERGFVIDDCGSRLDSVDIYRQKICSLIQAPATVKSSFEATYGVSPDELCAMVNSLAIP